MADCVRDASLTPTTPGSHNNCERPSQVSRRVLGTATKVLWTGYVEPVLPTSLLFFVPRSEVRPRNSISDFANVLRSRSDGSHECWFSAKKREVRPEGISGLIAIELVLASFANLLLTIRTHKQARQVPTSSIELYFSRAGQKISMCISTSPLSIYDSFPPPTFLWCCRDEYACAALP